MHRTFGVDAHHVLDVGLRDASDEGFYEAARDADAIVVTKDIDFVALLERRVPPPAVVWLTIGNCTNAALRERLGAVWPMVMELLAAGESVVEVSRAR